MLQKIPIERFDLVTSDGTVYETRDPRYDGKKDHFFNESGKMEDPHGHVVESRSSTPQQTQYDFVRDAAGAEYINNGPQHQQRGGGDQS